MQNLVMSTGYQVTISDFELDVHRRDLQCKLTLVPGSRLQAATCQFAKSRRIPRSRSEMRATQWRCGIWHSCKTLHGILNMSVVHVVSVASSHFHLPHPVLYIPEVHDGTTLKSIRAAQHRVTCPQSLISLNSDDSSVILLLFDSH